MQIPSSVAALTNILLAALFHASSVVSTVTVPVRSSLPRHLGQPCPAAASHGDGLAGEPAVPQCGPLTVTCRCSLLLELSGHGPRPALHIADKDVVEQQRDSPHQFHHHHCSPHHQHRHSGTAACVTASPHPPNWVPTLLLFLICCRPQSPSALAPPPPPGRLRPLQMRFSLTSCLVRPTRSSWYTPSLCP